MKFRSAFPLPDVDWPPTREFWAAAARGELAVPRCDGCRRYKWFPDGACRFCGAGEHTWTRVSGRGRLFTWSVVHRAFIPALADRVPYVTGLVAIDEDPAVRLATFVGDCAPDRLHIDMPMQVVFRPLRFAGVAGEAMAPFFVPA